MSAILEPIFILKRDHIQEIFRKTGNGDSESYPLEIEITLAGADEVVSVLDSIRRRPDRDSILGSLLDDCTACLRRAMEVQEYFGQASCEHDWTSMWLRSIANSSDRHHRRTWLVLIKLASECLDSAIRDNPALARSQADYWKTIGYPVFTRLACYALARPGLFPIEQSLDYVLSCDSAMWRYTCRVELCELLKYLGPQLTRENMLILVRRLLIGPPAGIYRAGLTTSEIEAASTDAIAERLSALKGSGALIPDEGEEFLERLQAGHASPTVVEQPAGLSFDEITTDEVADVLAGGIAGNRLLREQWELIVKGNWNRALEVLRVLSARNKWIPDVWELALGAGIGWALNDAARTEEIVSMLDLLPRAPEPFITQSAHAITQLLEFAPRQIDPTDNHCYWLVWEKTLSITSSQPISPSDEVQGIQGAMNTTVGRLIETLFEWVSIRSNAGKPTVPKIFWEKLQSACEISSDLCKAARAIAAMYLPWLFSKNAEWVKHTLLPSFDWDHPSEAKVVWEGFLCRPNFDEELWPLLKNHFLRIFDHAEVLAPESARSLYQLFARIAVHYPQWMAHSESQPIVTHATHVGRQQIAWIFWRNLDDSGERAATLWRNRIGSWLEACWQPDTALKSAETTENLIPMALATGDAFPEAVEVVQYRIAPVKNAETVIFAISRSQVPERFPEATATLLDLGIDRSQRFYKAELVALLARISQNWPAGAQDRCLQDLLDFANA